MHSEFSFRGFHVILEHAKHVCHDVYFRDDNRSDYYAKYVQWKECTCLLEFSMDLTDITILYSIRLSTMVNSLKPIENCPLIIWLQILYKNALSPS
jgi:hypothetical protein